VFIDMIKRLTHTVLGRLRIIAFLEGCSFLLLGFTMILKYKFSMPQPNYVVGMFHGLLFITYVFILLQVAIKDKWKFTNLIWAFLASLLPFGTFLADKKLFRYKDS
jgi:integral membrane protein